MSAGHDYTGAAAEAFAACIEACDHQIDVGCPGTPETYRPYCVRACEQTVDKALEECFDELVAMERCAAALSWECDSFGSAQTVGNCATEGGACLQCMGGEICAATGL